MRNQFAKTLWNLMLVNPRIVVLLGDIGVHSFREVFKDFPTRCYNMGICEQSMVSVAAGLASKGFIPVIHSIAPFVVERCLEQIKDDFGYQNLGINIVSVGASYDYASLGCTHHCPADVAVLLNVPGANIFVPGTAEEFDSLFRQTYESGINYFRLSERQNAKSYPVKSGEDLYVKTGFSDRRIVAVGNVLDMVLEAAHDWEGSIVYQTHVDAEGEGFYVEPYYSHRFGVNIPKKFLTNYGKAEEHDRALGFTVENIRNKIQQWMNS